ncbi:MAG: hypothetical protein KAI66_22280, partial [Lentisphaeria bacterium]|nr:hypothetical protein [Lentisphaeria bacterium]
LLDPLRDWTFVAHGIGLAGSEATLVVEQLDADEQVLLKTAAEPPKQTEGWRRHTVTFNLLPTARQVRLLCVNDGKGSAVFDNAWLRPAWENEIIDDAETFPVMVGIFPADVVAAIDRTPPVITIPSRQAGAIVLHLHGDRETKAQTRVEIEAPDWLKLRTAQMATYGKEPLEATTRAAQVAGRTLFTFTDPYNWQRSMRGGKPNPYTGLMVVWRAVAAPGTEDTVTIRTFLGEQQGQVRDIKLAVREPIPQVPEPKRFKVGIWGLGWLHVRDKDAYRDLLQTYVNAGVRRGSMHESHGHALPVMKEVGFEPTMILHAVNSTLPYKSLPADKRPPYAVGLEGKQVKHYIALAAALNDPDVHALYRKYLKRYLRSYPDFGKVGVIDIEFWGDG